MIHGCGGHLTGGRCELVLSRLILDASPQPDASGRRVGFGQAWQAAMAEHGWVPTGQRGVFARPPAEA